MLKILSRSLFVTGLVTLFGFLNNLITARGLGVDGRGEYASILLLMTIAGGVSQLGLGQAFVYQHRSDTNYDGRRSLYLCLFISTVIAFILGAVGNSYPHANTTSSTSVTATLTALFSAYSLILTCSQIDPRLTYYNISKLCAPLFIFIALLYLINSKSLTIQNLVIIQSVSFLAASIPGALIIHQSTHTHEIRLEKLTHVAKTFALGIKYHLTTMLGLITVNLDKIYLYLYSTDSGFGLYSVAFTTSRLMGALQETISTALFSKFAGKKEDEITEFILFVFRITFIPLIITAAIIGSISENLITLIFGSEFSSASTTLSILLIESVIGGASWMLAQQFNATGQPGIVLFRQAISILPLAVLLPFLPKDNINESLAGLLLISSLTRLITTIFLLKIRLKIKLPTPIPTIADIKLIATKLRPREY